MEVKARYLWLTTVVIMLVAELYASILCGMIVYQSHLRPRMIVVAGIGTILASTGLLFLLTLDDPPYTLSGGVRLQRQEPLVPSESTRNSCTMPRP